MSKDAPSGDGNAPSGKGDAPPLKDWQVKQREFEQVKARAKALKLRLTCTICGEKAKLNCPCGTTQYCSVGCQRIDWRERGHRKACKKIRNERAAEAARAEAPTQPPEEVVYGPAPRSHADEVRARIAAEHEAARARREANPEPEPRCPRFGSCCPICLEKWDVNKTHRFRTCCCRQICSSCENKIDYFAPCPLCRAPFPDEAEELARIRRHVANEVPEAIYHLGLQYQIGGHFGLVKNERKAAKIYKRAMELGSVNAMGNLGYMYLNGYGVKFDRKKALQLFRLAAERGGALDQFNVALTLDQDDKCEEAIRWYRLSADQGYTEAEETLGRYYREGARGVELDLDKANFWITRAVGKGHEGAIEELALLREKERLLRTVVLRFAVGDRVEISLAPWPHEDGHGWAAGEVVALWWHTRRAHDADQFDNFYAPYQVRLDDGDLMFVPEDTIRRIRRPVSRP